MITFRNYRIHWILLVCIVFFLPVGNTAIALDRVTPTPTLTSQSEIPTQLLWETTPAEVDLWMAISIGKTNPVGSEIPPDHELDFVIGLIGFSRLAVGSDDFVYGFDNLADVDENSLPIDIGNRVYALMSEFEYILPTDVWDAGKMPPLPDQSDVIYTLGISHATYDRLGNPTVELVGISISESVDINEDLTGRWIYIYPPDNQTIPFLLVNDEVEQLIELIDEYIVGDVESSTSTPADVNGQSA